MKRPGILASLLFALSLAFAGPVLAAPPANDAYADAAVIGATPFSDTLDTSEATTDAVDAEANAGCGAPATDASVWYSLTAAADGGVVVDVSASDYSAGVIVVTGSPGSFSLLACGPGTVAFGTSAGETYSILVFDDQLDGAGNGGTLQLNVTDLPPPPTLEISVDPVGRFNAQTGSATVHGSVTCADADFVFLDVQLRQTVGRFIITGYGSTELVGCDGSAQAWSVEVFPETGVFRGGRSASVTFAFACGIFECAEAYQERTIMLRR